MRSIGVAHQYLAKPCESATLKAAIAQTQLLRNLLSSDSLAKLVGHVGTLSSAPVAFQELVTCLQQPTSSVADAARIVGRNVAMTANIMKLVNSAFFGSRQPIATVDRAVAYLGLDTLGALVVCDGVFRGGASSSIAGFSLERLWQHSLQTAIAARAIARIENQPATRAEEAFLAGVLHDVGKLVYATRSAVVNDPAASGDDTVAQIEAHHPEVGAYLLGLWGFPNSIVEAIDFHYTPSLVSGDGFGLAGLVHVANRLVHQHEAQGTALSDSCIEPGYLEKLGLTDHVPQWSAALAALQ
jgi:HD-like signal output (HDOD) protein